MPELAVGRFQQTAGHARRRGGIELGQALAQPVGDDLDGLGLDLGLTWPATAEAMYAPELRGNSEDIRLQIDPE